MRMRMTWRTRMCVAAAGLVAVAVSGCEPGGQPGQADPAADPGADPSEAGWAEGNAEAPGSWVRPAPGQARVVLPPVEAVTSGGPRATEPEGQPPIASETVAPSGPSGPAELPAPAAGPIVPAGSCDDVVEQMKAEAAEQMLLHLEGQRSWHLDIVGWVGDCSDPNTWWWGDDDSDCDGDGLVDYPPTGASPKQVSGTNNQVANVAEADLVKTDGGFMYVLASDRLVVIDAWPPEQAMEIASVPLVGKPKRMFLHQDRAFVYSAIGDGSVMDCTYGFDCDFVGDGSDTLITVLDVSTPSAPTRVRELKMSGSFIAARRIGDAVHTVVHFDQPKLPPLPIVPPELNNWWNGCEPQLDADAINALYDALVAENLATIEAYQLTDLVPSAVETVYVGGQGYSSTIWGGECTEFMLGPDSDDRMMGVISTDITAPAGVSATMVLGRPGATYVSTDSLYVATREKAAGGLYESTIHKFGLWGSASVYAGSGKVKGWALNQFAMDEFEGHLRIATTTSKAPSPAAHSTISVLADTGGTLEVVGQIDQIAPTEDIRSVRFDGTRGFIVTFKKTDPLFSFDLSVPETPVILGELKIPGFSTYMHLMDETHLLTIGYDADDQGSFAWFQGIILQIFDVSDMTAPILTHKEVIGTRGSTSEAATNHLAFNYFAPKDLLAIPMVICEGGGGGKYGYLQTFNGLLVYDVTAEGGFASLGGISHIEAETQPNKSGQCNTWWTKAGSKVRRSVIMDDYVFSIAPDAVKVDHLSALGVGLNEIPL